MSETDRQTDRLREMVIEKDGERNTETRRAERREMTETNRPADTKTDAQCSRNREEEKEDDKN